MVALPMIAPEIAARLWSAYERRAMDDAFAAYAQVAPFLHSSLGAADYVGVIKVVLHHRRVIESAELRLPLVALSGCARGGGHRGGRLARGCMRRPGVRDLSVDHAARVTWTPWSQGGMALVDGLWRHALAIEREDDVDVPQVRVCLVEDVALPDMQTYARELHAPAAREVIIPLTSFAADDPAAKPE